MSLEDKMFSDSRAQYLLKNRSDVSYLDLQNAAAAYLDACRPPFSDERVV